MQERKDKKDNLLLPALTRKRGLLRDRRVSIKWFLAIICMGIFGAAFMGTALFTTTDGRVQLSKLAQSSSHFIFAHKGVIQRDRLSPIMPLQRFGAKKEIDIGVSQKDFGSSVIRPQKFELVHLSLSEMNAGRFKYPPFNALSLFDNSPNTAQVGSIDQLYNGKVDAEIIFKKLEFNPSNVTFSKENTVNSAEAELNIRKSFNRFSDGSTNVDNLIFNYVKNNDSNVDNSNTDKKTEVNISYIHKSYSNNNIYNYTEDLIPFIPGKSISKILESAHYSDKFANKAASALTDIITSDQLKKASIIRLGLEADEDGNEIIVRASLYNNVTHIATVAMNDDDIFEKAQEPETTSLLKKSLSGKLPNVTNLNGRTIALYDSIYRSALNYALSPTLIKQMMRIMATDIDLQGPTNNNDTIDIFFPLQQNSKEQEDIIYIQANINDRTHKYYRYKALNGIVDYYNIDGKSAKRFLLRKPVPDAHFSSPFGARRHPILGYVRMHTGVDWAAPLHSVIVASGDGIVTKMGPTPGYGNHTEIQHANGYMTSYSHQSGFAAGIKPGVHVHQGQVIGYIGSTGLSTGAHCHFEIVVNGIKQNPMRVHLPNGKVLKGRDLSLFEQKRNSIDTTLNAHRF